MPNDGQMVYNKQRDKFMVITISNTDDFIRALRENEEFRAAAWREMQIEGMLKLPDEFREFREDTNRRFDALLKNAEATNRRLDAIEEDISVIREDINRLGNSFREEVKAQSSYRGAHAQTAANADRIIISNLFAKLHGIKRTDAMPVPRRRLKDWLRGENTQVVEALDLRERAWETFLQPDIVAAVHDLMADEDSDPMYYIVIEASYTVQKEDVLKATDHAKIVHAVTGSNAYAVVAGVNLDDDMDAETQNRLYEDVERLVEAKDPNAAYWHRLASTDLKPREPR